MKHDWIPNAILHGILACCLFNIWGCYPDPMWCEHRRIAPQHLEEASNFIRESLRVSRPGREPVLIHEAEGVADRMYGYCPYNCKGENYLRQAERDIPLETAINMVVLREP